MSQIIYLAIGSINQATAGYQQAGGEGLGLFSLDEATLEFRRIACHAIANPSFISVDPTLNIIYATQELADEEGGRVNALSFSIESGTIVPLNNQPTQGRIPAHNMVTRDKRFVLVANYGSQCQEPNQESDASLCILPILPDGRLDAPCASVKIQGNLGPVCARQQRPHAHMVSESPTDGTIWAADLGLDLLIQYKLDQYGRLIESARLDMPTGSGPRHIAQHPNGRILYVVGELDSTVSVIRQSTDTFERLQHFSLIEEKTGSYAADIHLSPDGVFLYISNRGEDTIVCLAVEPLTGLLTLRQRIASGGKTPRNFAVTPTGRHLIVAHQNSDEITIFRRDAPTGILTATGKSLALANAVCVQPFIVSAHENLACCPKG